MEKSPGIFHLHNKYKLSTLEIALSHLCTFPMRVLQVSQSSYLVVSHAYAPIIIDMSAVLS